MKKLLILLILMLLTVRAYAEKDLCTQVINRAEPTSRINFDYNAFDQDKSEYISNLVLSYDLKDEEGNVLKTTTVSHKIAGSKDKLSLEQMINLVKQEIGNICTYVQQDKLDLANEEYHCN